MALAVPQTTSNTGPNIGTIDIAKPNNLAVGELMVAGIAAAAGSGSISAPAGWTQIEQPSTVEGSQCAIFAIKATSTEVAASNFTFTKTSAELQGGIVRITGGDSDILPEVSDSGGSSTNTSSPSISTSLTPRVPNNIALVLISADITGSGSITALSKTPSSTFTNVFNVTNTGVGRVSRFGYAIISDDSEITAFGGTASRDLDEFVAALAVFRELYPTSGTTNLLETSPTFFTYNGSAGTNGTAALHSAGPTFFTQSGSSSAPTQWTNEAEESTTWANENSL